MHISKVELFLIVCLISHYVNLILGVPMSSPQLARVTSDGDITKKSSPFSAKTTGDNSKVRNSTKLTRQLSSNERHTADSRHTAREKHTKVELSNMFREEIENYPEEEIRLILMKTPTELKELYNVVNTVLDPNMNLTERVAHHYNDEDDQSVKEESVCRTVIRSIYPREAHRDNSPVYVPNNQEFMQVIQAEICQYPDQDCSYLQDNLPYGMSSVCHQKYAFKKLLYLDPLEKRMASDLFRYPSCCSCYVRSAPLDLRSSLSSTQSPSDSSSEKRKAMPETIINSNEWLSPSVDKASPINDSATKRDTVTFSNLEFKANNSTFGDGLDSIPSQQFTGSSSLESDTIFGKRRQSKAFPTSSNSNRTRAQQIAQDVVHIDEANKKKIESTTGSNRTTTPAPSKVKLTTVSQTVVLTEDKIYKPSSDA